MKWYLSAYHAGRKSGVAKKPYNPILGEVFFCHWNVPGSMENSEKVRVENGPVPWCTRDQLTFAAEQVSHHPPSSYFSGFCQLENNRVDTNTCIFFDSKPKKKFLVTVVRRLDTRTSSSIFRRKPLEMVGSSFVRHFPSHLLFCLARSDFRIKRKC